MGEPKDNYQYPISSFWTRESFIADILRSHGFTRDEMSCRWIRGEDFYNDEALRHVNVRALYDDLQRKRGL